MPLIVGVVNVVDPLNKGLPPDEAAYQSIVSPAPAVADKTTVPVPHLEPGVPEGVDGFVLTVAVTETLVRDTQPVVAFLDAAK